MLIVAYSVFFGVNAQKKDIGLDDLGLFIPASIGEVVNYDEEHFLIISDDNRSIDKIEYKSGKKIGSILDLSVFNDVNVNDIEGFELSESKNRILFYTNRTKIYRRSFTADYYLYDVERKKITPLSAEGQEQAASLAPNGDMAAYVRGNNIHLVKIRFGTESAITDDGKKDFIINGIPDWNYEEEYALNKSYEWSPNSEEIAYVKYDESKVSMYSFSVYKASFPEVDSCELYPGQYKFKYPKTGGVNSKVSVHVFNIKNRTTKTMNIGEDEDFYIPRIKWSPIDNELGVVKINRLQNQLEIYLLNTQSGVGHVVLTDRNERYIDDSVYDNWDFLSDGSGFIYMCEKDGYNHLYHYSMAGKEINQITKGDWDVTEYIGYDSNKKMVYFESSEESPLQRNIYQVRIDGKNKKRLNDKAGVNSAFFSNGWNYFICNHSDIATPTSFSVHNNKGEIVVELLDNDQINKRVNEYNFAKKEFIQIPNRDGLKLNAWIIKPDNYDSSHYYPLLIVQYSGPAQQYVKDEWRVGWEQYLVSKGYIVVGIDPRGTGARGEEFRKTTYMNFGIKESDDLIDVAKYLGEKSYVDRSRIGIWGWSHGGYMSLMCMSRSDIFKIGISVAAVTDWKYYDTAYTERYMRRPFENGTGYKLSSPINLVKDLKGKLLLIHGTADDNVHFQNMMEYVDALVQADKQFDMFVYPNRNHNLRGGNTYNHLYKLMSNYIINNL